MNRFRTKKKGKDDASIGRRPSVDAEPSGPFRMFGKKKTQDDEPKTEVDLSAALPSSDDFRTSLLMTGLSARFSMLREQDDPNSKLGKASDDSVLQPKRQSRMVDFGVGLHDISEVESLKGPQMGRFDSYQSDDTSSTTGSIMSRAKPNEGNNLFGGRQKIYKLAAGSRAGMSGRTLYEDDVAQSSFQRWRQAEKEKNATEPEHTHSPSEADSTLDYSKRRETSSTTSSAPSAARNSTAETSIASQPSSFKDAHVGPMPGPERSVTRTRRLYEQGLNQDLHDHQSSALSRMDTLSKQRPFRTRTPDPASRNPSPSAGAFGDRVTDRRTIISKASAPNLRSFSSSSTTSSKPHMSPAEPAMSKFTRFDQKLNLGSTPPLSPPISETEEPSGLAIQLADRAKATAVGAPGRPTVQYDESRYGQRQRQLQQGRDVSVSRNTMGPAPSSMRERSRSSSAQRSTAERLGPQTPLPDIPVQKEVPGRTVFDDADNGSANSNRPELPAVPPQLTIKRPDDQDHPAFRKSALPTPLLLSSPKGPDGRASPTNAVHCAPPEDSPTLGPNGGLTVSGMIRHHLRNCSGASSMYGAANHEAETAAEAEAAVEAAAEAAAEEETSNRTNNTSPKSSEEINADGGGHNDRDEFAQHLADGARRIRERLTTYVESDNDHSAPPTPPQSEQNRDFFSSSKSVGLGALGSKSSRGLFDRSEKERGRAIGSKTSGSLHGTVSVAPSSRNTSRSRGPSRSRAGTIDQSEMVMEVPEENLPAGLKAFRQARRELQRMKELDVQHRHGGQRSSPSLEHPPNGRLPPYENGPPPALFNRMPRGDDQTYGGRSRAASRAASERDRSGSETSNGGRNFSRGGPRLRNGSVNYDEPFGKPGAVGAAYSDAQRPESPYMGNAPPQAFVMSHNPGFGGRPEPNGRYFAPNMQVPPPLDNVHYGRSRKGSLIGAAVSAPNLYGSAAAPPLPPINPRRKNGFARSGEEGSADTSPTNGFGMTDGHGADDDAAADHFRRARIASNGQLRHSPPMVVRPPVPRSQISSASLPGGMI
ncbi:hypothetical protein E4U53_005508 [Claviceps sorghi]|nr:hypothetical protein E4U53_005508 [Claviceps sorghi]